MFGVVGLLVYGFVSSRGCVLRCLKCLRFVFLSICGFVWLHAIRSRARRALAGCVSADIKNVYIFHEYLTPKFCIEDIQST